MPKLGERLWLGSLFLAQVANARLKIFLASSFGDVRVGRGLLRLQIFDACRAVSARHCLDMEFHVVGGAFWQHAEKIAAELLARGTAEPMSPPDFAKRMNARIAATVDRCQLLLQTFIAAKRILNGRHPLGGQCLVEISLEIGIREFGGHDLNR